MAAIMALTQRDERPAMKPMFSPTGIPYYRAWRAAIYCWATTPTRRPPMEDVALMLQPSPTRLRGLDSAPRTGALSSMQSLSEAGPEHPSLESSDSFEEVEEDDAETGSDGDSSEPSEDTDCYCGGYPDSDMIECSKALDCQIGRVSTLAFLDFSASPDYSP